MIETNTTQKDWDDFWESVNEDQSIPQERELFESNEDNSLTVNAYVDDVLSGKNNICLLYTSPSPRDATLSRMPSSA